MLHAHSLSFIPYMSETLIIFSRYPEPGKTKTRMIPALGAEGAAELQRQMSEHTIAQARSFIEDRQTAIAVYFAGGNEELMSQWLGEDLRYVPQAEGDLGEKMRSAFEAAFAAGSQRVIVIGIDCPDIDCEILASGFAALGDGDLVLGSAVDGGYYLIGLSHIVPELLQNISWGTERVLEQTLKIARQQNLNFTLLPELADVDSPGRFGDLAEISLIFSERDNHN